MCQELGDEATMQAYVEEQGSTSLCSAATGAGCSEKEKTFLEKWQSKSAADVSAQLARLSSMQDSSMKPELAQWITQRMAILKQLAKADEL